MSHFETSRTLTYAVLPCPPLPFFENQKKKCSDFGKKGPVSNFGVNFSCNLLKCSYVVLLVFWKKNYWSVLVPQNFSYPENFLLHACTQVLFLQSRAFKKCLTVSWIYFCVENCSVIYTVTLRYVLHEAHWEFWHIHIHKSFYSGIFRRFQEYSTLLRHIEAFSRHIHASSASFVTLAYSQPCHILSPGIFTTRSILKILWNFDQAYSEPCHSQRPEQFIRALFRHIQSLV